MVKATKKNNQGKNRRYKAIKEGIVFSHLFMKEKFSMNVFHLKKN